MLWMKKKKKKNNGSLMSTVFKTVAIYMVGRWTKRLLRS